VVGLGFDTGRRGLRLVCLGAHPDDIEIGCGGTVLRLARERRLDSVAWVVFSGSEERAAEARNAAAEFLAGVPDAQVAVHTFRDGYFPAQHAEVKDVFEGLKRETEPDLVFTHARCDRHQDHRVLSDLAWNTWRDHVVLEYEIPKYDGDLETPNLYVALDDDTRRRKVGLLMDAFSSQRGKPWFDEDTFNGLMRLRGVEANAPTRFAEGFFARKLRL
jgi:LmbE family N-acetylglucosaminyl deacetylase